MSDNKTEDQASLKIEETENQTIPLSEQVEETESILIDQPEQEPEETNDTMEVSQENCERLYGVAMETGHALLKKKGYSHRPLPEERRKAQGKLLYEICQRYNIQIPNEFDVIILGGAIVADWQYMNEKETTQENTKNEDQQ